MGLLLSTAETFDFDAELLKQKEQRTVEVAGEPMKGCGPVRRNVQFAAKLETVPFGERDGEEPCDTLWKSFCRGVRINGDGNLMGSRRHEGPETFGPYRWTTYNQGHAEVLEVASGLRKLGVRRGDRVGVCSVNRAEWVYTALAIYSQGFVTVALYDTFGNDAIEYIVDHSESRVVLCSTAKLDLVVGTNSKSLKTVVVFDADERYNNVHEVVPDATVRRAAERGIEIITYSRLREMGRETPVAPEPGQRDDLCFIMYTSGTTGMPKGVMLSHGNVMAAVAGLRLSACRIQQDDIHFSFLPLAHIYETAVQAALWCHGASMGFYSGHVKRMTADLLELRPTVFGGVPRVYQKIYDKLVETVSQAPFVRRTLFYKALYSDAYKVRRGIPLDPTSFSQRVVFAGVRQKLGLDRCRVMLTGAAPCPPYLMEFLRVAINPSVGVVQGYGMTETAAGLTVTEPNDHTLGHVGAPLASVEVRLRDVEDMGYTAANNTGEIMAHGPTIFKGYYKDEENTRATITEDGWLGTGDIGRWNPNGTLSIIDRKKNIFKLAQGEYIPVEKVEAVYGRTPGVNQVFIYGNSYKTCLVAVVVPSWAHWHPIFVANGWWGQGPDADAKNPERSPEYRAHFTRVVREHEKDIIKTLMEDSKKVADAAKLQSFEKVHAILIEAEIDELGTGFNVANDLLTPTFKLRRAQLVKRYVEKLKATYAELGEPPKADEKW